MPTEIIITMPSKSKSEFRLKGWHVLAMFVAFFAVVGSVNGIMLRMALSTMPGLDARNGYDVSQSFNKRIAAARDQDALGLKVEESIRRAGEGAQLTIELTDKAGKPVRGAIVAARLEHPAIRTRDITLALSDDGTGRYIGTLASVANGGWTVVIEVRQPDVDAPIFVSRNRVTLGGT